MNTFLPYVGCPVVLIHEDCNDKHVRNSAAFITGGILQGIESIDPAAVSITRVGLFVMPYLQGFKTMDHIQVHQTKELAIAEFERSKGVDQAYYPS